MSSSVNVQETISNVQEHVANAVETAREVAHSVTTKVTDFFQGDPFETPIGAKIELATDATKLAVENWELNFQICDSINDTDEGARNAARAIRKRLQTQMGKNDAIIMFTLTVLETCVKNCNQKFKAYVCQKEFVNEMVKLIGSKVDVPQTIQERVLNIIQSWAYAFRGNPALSGVVEFYDELKSKGVEFPPIDYNTISQIITPKSIVFSDAKQEQKSYIMPKNQQQKLNENQFIIIDASNGPIVPSSEQLTKLRSELDLVNVNLNVLRELLGTLTPNREDPSNFELLQQLYVTCQEMQKRIVELISTISNEEVTYELLTINDEFNTIFEKYNRYMTNRNLQSGPSGASIHEDLIDLNDTDSLINQQFKTISLKKNDDQKIDNNIIQNQATLNVNESNEKTTKIISELEAEEITNWLTDKNEINLKKAN